MPIGVFVTKYQLTPHTAVGFPPFPTTDQLTSIISAALTAAGWPPVEIETGAPPNPNVKS